MQFYLFPFNVYFCIDPISTNTNNISVLCKIQDLILHKVINRNKSFSNSIKIHTPFYIYSNSVCSILSHATFKFSFD
jgi:hypothetical protein